MPLIGALAYLIAVLTLSLFASGQLYDWARDRIVAFSVVSVSDSVSRNTIQRNGSAAAGADGVALADTAVTSDSPESSGVAVPPINVLLLGTDARPEDDGPPLTDTLILLSLDPQGGAAGMLSLPRDLWVPIAGQGVTTKINTAYMIGENRGYPGGGPQLVKDTVSSFVGRPVQYYVRVSFDGFVEIIDMIGGFDLVVPEEIHDENYPTADYKVETFHLDAGIQHLDGATALKYVRTRNVDSDYGRSRRQQQVIRAVVDKVLRADMIPVLLAKAPRLMYTMRSSIDTDMPMAVQLELANYLADASLSEIRQLVLDGRYGEETYSEEGAWILLPDRARVRAALNTFFSPVVRSQATDSVAANDPGWIRIEVLNGTDKPGVAARTRDMLQSQGWRVVSIGDADRDDYGHTLIVNYGIPDSLVKRVSSDLDITPNLSMINGLNTAAPFDMRIVVGEDMLSKVE